MLKPRGATLFELLVVLAIAAALMALAAPSFAVMIANSRVRSATAGIAGALQLARAEAVRRNTDVTFTMPTTGGWSVTYVDATTTNPVTLAAVGPNDSGALHITEANTQTTVSFTPLGVVNNYLPANILTSVTVAPPDGASSTFKMHIDVYAGGQVRVCEPGTTKVDDPRHC